MSSLSNQWTFTHFGKLGVSLAASEDSLCDQIGSCVTVCSHQPVETVIRLKNGMLLLPSDNGSTPAGTAIHLSADNGKHFVDPGGNIAGLHGAVVELNNGSLLVGISIVDRQLLSFQDGIALTRKNQRSFFDVSRRLVVHTMAPAPTPQIWLAWQCLGATIWVKLGTMGLARFLVFMLGNEKPCCD